LKASLYLQSVDFAEPIFMKNKNRLPFFLLLTIICITRLEAQNWDDNVDLYGTSQISLDQVKHIVGADISELFLAYKNKNKPLSDSLKKTAIDKVHKMGNFAYVAISPITYFREGNPVYITIDIVDSIDAGKRMPFTKSPTKNYKDPDSLMYYWAKYEEIGMPLMQTNKIDYSAPCPAFHCLFGFAHPELQTFAKRFLNEVEPNKVRLTEILKEDKDPSDRASAAYLLAHMKDGQELVKVLLPSIYDNSSLVRNNVMRVLSDIGAKHPDISIPLEIILQAVKFPNVSDRNKALAVLHSLAKQPKLKEEIRRKAGNTLVDLLKLKQLNNRLPAYNILKELSGQDFGETNYTAWSQWINS
jgi:hypothetical protein